MEKITDEGIEGKYHSRRKVPQYWKPQTTKRIAELDDTDETVVELARLDHPGDLVPKDSDFVGYGGCVGDVGVVVILDWSISPPSFPRLLRSRKKKTLAWSSWSLLRRSPAATDLDKSTSTSSSLKKLQEDGALLGRGTMEREPGGTEPKPVLGRMVAVEDYILYGFLPPPSEFLLLVLNFYGLSLLHLNPNSIAFLSIFSYLCEAYIGVEPFLDLFRFYYELRWMEPKKVSGCVGFRLRDGMKSRYIPFQCPSSRSKWRGRWFYLQIENSDPVFIVPEEQPDKIPEWTTKPALTPSLQSFIDVIDDLRVRGLLGYEVTADFIGLNSETVKRRVGQVMISGTTTASKVPVPLCEKGKVDREAAINVLPLTDVIGPLVDHQVVASLKEGVAQEASDVPAAATTSGGNIPKRGRKFSSVLGNRRKAPTTSSKYLVLTPYSFYLGLGCVSPASATAEAGDTWREPVFMAITEILHRAARAKAVQDGSGGNSSASPAAASTNVVVVPRSCEATPSGLAGGLVPARGPPADILTWGSSKSRWSASSRPVLAA
uniref:Retrotransposon protein, putative, Ty3-gypsy sub-class n=1 Tax=Oryza sativa subsp. japonica TaxID=39947 RepID=Q53MV3_ORYSJ|nr:retrotransposon protein, putative, Ty3-gypsy sub-class [Oryza sativa Japonica Group]